MNTLTNTFLPYVISLKAKKWSELWGKYKSNMRMHVCYVFKVSYFLNYLITFCTFLVTHACKHIYLLLSSLVIGRHGGPRMHFSLIFITPSSPLILGGRVWWWWTNASYANRMGSRLIIFSFIVGQQKPCGMPSLPGSVFVGLCLAWLRIYLLAGGRVVVQGVLLCEKWFLFVLCGVFGGREMIDVLRILWGLARRSSIFFFLPFSPGQRAGLPAGD